ncbi:MAG: hypothetical protein K0U72_11920 [Gammaproteobacteria bacterium]|nr:hypothetical protein [Gammaproteobacteria bacterium]
MNASIRSLATKELRQHLMLLLWVLVFTALVAWLLLTIQGVSGGGLSYLSITSIFANPVLVIIAFVLGQRIISAEYYGQTQRFIEALPVRRSSIHWVKYWVGFAYLLVAFSVAWLSFLAAAKGNEPISARFVGLMYLRMSAYVFALWSLIFTFSLLGRLRVPLIAAAAFAASMINMYTSFEMDRFGPMALMDMELFAFSRSTIPVRHLLETVAFGGTVFLLGMWMARSRDGSLMETLATPVTSRAKGFIVALGITALGVASYFGAEPEAEPFAYSSPYVLADGNVEIAYLEPELEPDALRLLQYVLERSATLDDVVPPADSGTMLRITYDPSLDASTFETEMTDPIEGVVIRSNFQSAPEWDVFFFGAYLFHNVVAERKEKRLYLEPYHWLLDGFTRWWAAYGDLTDAPTDTWFDPIMLEALHVARDAELSVGLLRDWETTFEIYGDTGAMTIAYSAFRILQEEIGTEALLEFVRSEFARPTYRDVRDWWIDWRDPLSERFMRATGMSIATFGDIWKTRMAELGESAIYRETLDAIAKPELVIETDIDEQGLRSVQYTLTLDRPLPTGSKCTFLHARLRSYDRPVTRSRFREVDIDWPAPGEHDHGTTLSYSLNGEYGQGTRLFAAMECKFPQFVAPLYLGGTRLTMP